VLQAADKDRKYFVLSVWRQTTWPTWQVLLQLQIASIARIYRNSSWGDTHKSSTEIKLMKMSLWSKAATLNKNGVQKYT